MGSPSALHLNEAELYSRTVDEVGENVILGGNTDWPVSPTGRINDALNKAWNSCPCLLSPGVMAMRMRKVMEGKCS